MTDYLFRNVTTGELIVRAGDDIFDSEGQLPGGEYVVAVVGDWAQATIRVGELAPVAVDGAAVIGIRTAAETQRPTARDGSVTIGIRSAA